MDLADGRSTTTPAPLLAHKKSYNDVLVKSKSVEYPEETVTGSDFPCVTSLGSVLNTPEQLSFALNTLDTQILISAQAPHHLQVHIVPHYCLNDPSLALVQPLSAPRHRRNLRQVQLHMPLFAVFVLHRAQRIYVAMFCSYFGRKIQISKFATKKFHANEEIKKS